MELELLVGFLVGIPPTSALYPHYSVFCRRAKIGLPVNWPFFSARHARNAVDLLAAVAAVVAAAVVAAAAAKLPVEEFRLREERLDFHRVMNVAMMGRQCRRYVNLEAKFPQIRILQFEDLNHPFQKICHL